MTVRSVAGVEPNGPPTIPTCAKLTIVDFDTERFIEFWVESEVFFPGENCKAVIICHAANEIKKEGIA